jgi:hypothetical protein
MNGNNMGAPIQHASIPQFDSLHANFIGNGLPFDNLDVQQLWDWMGNLDEFDNYSYQGSL